MGGGGTDTRVRVEEVSGVNLEGLPSSGGVGTQRTEVDKDRSKMGVYSIVSKSTISFLKCWFKRFVRF